MKLDIYLKEHRLTLAEFGDRVGRSAATVQRWCTRERSPSMASVRAIIQATDGAVGFDDFADPRVAPPQPEKPADGVQDDSDRAHHAPTMRERRSRVSNSLDENSSPVAADGGVR